MERVDLRGLECPVPTLRTVEAVQRARPAGTTVTVLVDDPVCAEEIPVQARRWSYAARVELTADSEWTIRLEPIGPATHEDLPSKEAGAA